jgi:hypothetical protein
MGMQLNGCLEYTSRVHNGLTQRRKSLEIQWFKNRTANPATPTKHNQRLSRLSEPPPIVIPSDTIFLFTARKRRIRAKG